MAIKLCTKLKITHMFCLSNKIINTLKLLFDNQQNAKQKDCFFSATNPNRI